MKDREDIEKRYEQFQCLELPGQPIMMHMGTSYLVNDLHAALVETEAERDLLLEWVWLNHGHTGQYGDDGEMQCDACEREYGFYDWKRTPVPEILNKIRTANIITALIAALQEDRDEAND